MNEDQTLKSLQLEFDEILTCIKPIYLNWKIPQDKISIAGWIKKLSNMKNLTVDSMHLRNLYILALYENLRRDIVCDPFTNSPPVDELPPLSNHLKQLIERFSTKQILGPDWLETDEKADVGFTENSADYEEDDYIGDLKFSGDMNEMKQSALTNTEKLLINKPSEFDSSESVVNNAYKCQKFNKDWLRELYNQTTEKECKISVEGYQISRPNDDDIRLRHKSMECNSFNKVQEKEMERRLVQLQNAYHEDILKLRHQNDIEIQNIINRKNLEINQIRNNYKDKLKEQEVQMQLLDSNSSDCLKQLQMFQETKLKEIEQLKKIQVDNCEKQNREYEQRISNLIDDFQKEKHKMTEEQNKREEIIIKESKDYFEKVKMEFNDKSIFTSRQISDLEADIAQLKNAKNVIVEKHEKLKSEKTDLTIELRKLQNDLTDSQKKHQFIENQYSRLVLTHDKDVQSLKDTLETALHKAECAADEIQAKSYDKIEKLECQVRDLQNRLQESTRSNESEMGNIISNYASEKNRMKQTYEGEIDNLKVQLKNAKSQFDSKLLDLEKKLNIKEAQLSQVNKEMEIKEKSAIQMVEDLRQEMTHNGDRQMRKKQFEYDHMECELRQEVQEKTREVTELMQQLSFHREETEIKLGEIRKWSDNRLATLTSDWKQEKQSLEADFQFQQNKTNEEHKKTIEQLNEEKNKKIVEIQNLFDNISCDIPILKRELYEQVQIHKKEKSDLIRSCESEKSKLVEEHKSAIENLNRQTMDYKCKMEEKHAENISQILIKTNEKLKEIETEYSERSVQSFKMINDLKSLTDKLKEEKFELLNSLEDLKNSLAKKHNAEIENMQKVIKSNLEGYKRELGNDQAKYKNLENHMEKKEYEMKMQIAGIKFEYESRLSKLMPLDVQNDYEETIQSLRSQITFLQQKIEILEDEINTVNKLKTHQNTGYSKHLCEQLYQS